MENYIFFIFSSLLIWLPYCHGRGDVIYAVNAGGEEHIDSRGIHYMRDPLNDQDIGTASDFGRSLIIARVPTADQIIFQTERYHQATFGYDIPLSSDGDYVIVLQFSEVYFNAPDQKVFSVRLNDVMVIPDLDIFEKVGRGVAHQEIVSFKLKDSKQLIFPDGTQTILTSAQSNSIRIDFIKGYKDNPKINAFYVMKGTPQDVPQLPALPPLDEPELIHHSEKEQKHQSNPSSSSKKVGSGPRTPDPYSTDESTGTFLPLLAAIGAAIPIVFCLCSI